MEKTARRLVSFASIKHRDLAHGLLHWWRSGEVISARKVTPQLAQFAKFCESKRFLLVMLPLFQSAALVAKAIACEELSDGPALRSLYAQLERHIHRCIVVAVPEDLLPKDLLRNFLYYVAQINSSAKVAVSLRRQFRLDRVKQAVMANQSQTTTTIGVGYHLAKAIRASVANETSALRDWLNADETTESTPKLARLKVRLGQLEPVLTLMGVAEPLACLQSINRDLQVLEDSADNSDEIRSRLAQSLVSLDVLLDQSARYSVKRTVVGTPVETNTDEVFVRLATDACLREARVSLSEVAESLEKVLIAKPCVVNDIGPISRQLISINLALQILPLPEASPLLQGLVDLLNRLPETPLYAKKLSSKSELDKEKINQQLATLLVSIDYYLACVFNPLAGASQLLLDAEEALLSAREMVDGNAANMPINLSEEQWRKHIEKLLPHLDALGLGIAHYRVEPTDTAIQSIAQAFSGLNTTTDVLPGSSIKLLAAAAHQWFTHLNVDSGTFSNHILDTLDDVHAAIPQVFDQLLNSYDQPDDLSELIERLQSWDGEDLTGAIESTELTLNVDEKLLADPSDDTDVDTDNTLQHVFYHECLSHMESLDEAVRLALEPNASETNQLPTEQMLRALHTLTGSAQTMDAPEIVSIVQPLQRAALARQRIGQHFGLTDTAYIGDLVMALRARLESMISGEPVGNAVRAVESKLTDFLTDSLPGSSPGSTGQNTMPQVRSLEEVFSEEADDIVQKLRSAINNQHDQIDQINEALTLLHTLKGSARMAGKASIAEHAHELESRVQESTSLDQQKTILQDGFSQLSQLVTHNSLSRRKQQEATEPDEAQPAPVIDSPNFSESGFDTLLDLATDVTVNQARLSDQLARLREVYQDIDSLSLRIRELSQAGSDPVDFSEWISDFEAARAVMRTALRQSEREQQQASRASAGLQQNLIRTRLVRIDEVSQRLDQTIDETCQAFGKRAKLRIEGGEITLDRALFRQLLPPLEHLARNAIVHGVENPEQRSLSGKEEHGELVLSASMDGTDLVIQFRDDGRGIDRDAINQKLKSAGESPIDTHEELYQALFSSGFSSVENPTEFAGHGLGLPAVKTSLEQIGGRVQLATSGESGTQITLRVPQRIVVNQAVLVDSGGVLYAIPVSYVDAVRLASASDAVPDHYKRQSLSYLVDGIAVRTGSKQDDSKVNEEVKRSSILVKAAGQALAIEVDQVIGYRELVTQALGPQVSTLKKYKGGSVLSDGRIVLILDLNRIVEQHSLVTSPTTIKPARESLRPVALIVDDSLTMRVAAESVLQQCGIAVKTSRDGVEALKGMVPSMPNLILLDLEMPRLDGVGFLKRAKEQFGEALPPVIVISSRDSAQTREQLRRLGAVRFLAKPYTQNQLQEAIEAAGLRLPDLTIA